MLLLKARTESDAVKQQRDDSQQQQQQVAAPSQPIQHGQQQPIMVQQLEPSPVQIPNPIASRQLCSTAAFAAGVGFSNQDANNGLLGDGKLRANSNLSPISGHPQPQSQHQYCHSANYELSENNQGYYGSGFDTMMMSHNQQPTRPIDQFQPEPQQFAAGAGAECPQPQDAGQLISSARPELQGEFVCQMQPQMQPQQPQLQQQPGSCNASMATSHCRYERPLLAYENL